MTDQGNSSQALDVDNWASIWVNGQQLTNHSGTWSTAITTTVPQAFLQSGMNTIAVKYSRMATPIRGL